MTISKKIGKYVKEKGYNLSEVARQTGIDYNCLYNSMYGEGRERELRANELLPLCVFLNIDFRDFADNGISAK